MLTHDLLAVATWNPCVTDMIHVANVLYLLSYMVRDILWLRVLSVAAGERLVAQGSVVEDMTVLLQGALEVRAARYERTQLGGRQVALRVTVADVQRS